jgi:hypothetical protein
MMAFDWILGAVTLGLTLLLIDSRRIPVVFLLLAGGAAAKCPSPRAATPPGCPVP